MYKLWKRVISLTLSLALLIPLAACGGGLSPDDATTYIQGILDENYKGIYDAEFLEMIDSTETEAQEIYQNSIEVEADFLIGSLMDNAPTEEQRSELIELYKEIYAKASYTVDTATEIDETTYGVKVTVAPIDIFHQLMDEVSSGHHLHRVQRPVPRHYGRRPVLRVRDRLVPAGAGHPAGAAPQPGLSGGAEPGGAGHPGG